jgi:hypothetical protein
MEIPMQKVSSSQIDGIGYDALTQTLAVRFTAKVGPGALYHYTNVPPGVFEALRTADSVGAYHAANIKWKYQYQKIEERAAA